MPIPVKFSSPGEVMLRFADPPGRRYKQDPVAWARERAGVELWSKQRDIVVSVRDHYQTAVHSCHQIGKSFTAALTACWWLDVHEAGTAFVVTTAPTQPQVEAILWREINKFHSTAGLNGRTNLTEWYMGKQLVAMGRKPADHNESAFQGLHAQYFLVIMDEACGIPKQLWDSASTLAANMETSRVLAIGNPDDPHGEFADNCLRSSDWNVIGIGYQDTPNHTGEPVSELVHDSLIHVDWVETRRRKWGEESALFQSKCLGQFPTVGDPFTTIPFGWASQCRYIELVPQGDIEAGIDIGGGNDRTVVQLRQGPVLLERHVFVNPDPMQTVAQVAEVLRERNVKRAKVDSIGIGWAFYGRLRELSSVSNPYGRDQTHGAEVVPINFAEKPPLQYERQFLNKRAWGHWIAREHSRLKTWDLTRADDDLIHELTASKYEIIDSNGMVKIEKKDEIIKRLGFSPDLADAVIYAYIPTTFEAIISDTTDMRRDLLAQSGPQDIWERNHREDALGSRPF
jgi:hypothetical protein